MKKTVPFLFLSLFFFAFTPPSEPLEGNSGGNEVKKFYRTAKWHYKHSDWPRAVPYLRECVNLEPDNARYSYMLGKSLAEWSKGEEALPHLIRAYNLDASSGKDIEYYLARSLHLEGRFGEAIEFYRASLRRLPEDDERMDKIHAGIQQCENGPKLVEDEKDYVIENMGEFVNSEYPEYAASYSADYTYMIFTSRRPRKIKQMAFETYYWEDINEEVYQAELVDTVWMKTQLFKRPIPKYRHDASISISPDGKTIIYYLDRNRGDIYIASQDEEGDWTKRESIGENINTKKYNEPSMCFAEDKQVMYFVSDKPDGLGSKDIYITRRTSENTWSDPENLGENINSEWDEDAPFLSADGKTLYFSSRGHNSMGGYDIFRSKMLPDGTWGEPENMGYPMNSTGDDIYYVESANGENFYFSSDRSGGFGEKDLYHGYPGRLPAEDCGPTEIAGTVFDKETKDPVRADVLFIDQRSQKVVSASQTDQEGKFVADLPPNLGKYDVEVNVDIKDGGTSGGGAGETGMVNVLAGRVVDDVNQESLNAMVELIDASNGKVVDVVSTNEKTGNYFLPVESGKKYVLRSKARNYLPLTQEFEVSPTGFIEAKTTELAMQPFQEEGNKIVLNWQFFDHDAYEIKNVYSEDLTNLVKVMRKVPDLKLRIIGHTDGDGSPSYNQVLSERRAEAVLDYLVQKGISAERLISEGRGELEPIYPNTNDRLKKWNRRVELYIIN